MTRKQGDIIGWIRKSDPKIVPTFMGLRYLFSILGFRRFTPFSYIQSETIPPSPPLILGTYSNFKYLTPFFEWGQKWGHFSIWEGDFYGLDRIILEKETKEVREMKNERGIEISRKLSREEMYCWWCDAEGKPSGDVMVDPDGREYKCSICGGTGWICACCGYPLHGQVLPRQVTHKELANKVFVCTSTCGNALA